MYKTAVYTLVGLAGLLTAAYCRPPDVPMSAAISNSFAFGGINATLALRAFR